MPAGPRLFGKPAKLRRVVQRFAVPPSQAIYVGDELRDGEAAQAAGIDFAAVAWGYSTPEALRAQRPARFFTERRGDRAGAGLSGRPVSDAAYATP